MDEKQFAILIDKLDKLSRVLVIPAVKDIGKEQDKIELLDSLGFKPSEIGKLLGKSPANVSVVLGNLRKKKKGPLDVGGRESATGDDSGSQESKGEPVA